MTFTPAPEPILVTTLGFAAASGLAWTRDALWVVADDGLELRQLQLDGKAIAAHRLLSGRADLPTEAKARKQAKPDFEALCTLPDGRLLALGSGSRRQRMTGSLFDPRTSGVQPIDLEPLYLALESRIRELNVEGAAVWKDALVLAHRGNSEGACDALICLDLLTALADLAKGRLGRQTRSEIVDLVLGTLDGSRLTLTDLATDEHGDLWFCAAAENTRDRYEDGRCAGSIVGRFDAQLAVAAGWRLPGSFKIEGLACLGAGRWLLVADADDPGIPSPLLQIRLAT